MKRRIRDDPFIDTNVIVYAFGQGDRRKDVARGLLANGGATGVQNLNEFVGVARRKLQMTWEEISDALQAVKTLFPAPVPLTLAVHEAGVRIAAQHGYGIFDALVIAAALENGSRVLYSEDMQDRQVIEGLEIRNPFGPAGTNPE